MKLAVEVHQCDFGNISSAFWILRSLKINLSARASQRSNKTPKNLKLSTNEWNTDRILRFCSQNEGRNSAYFVLV